MTSIFSASNEGSANEAILAMLDETRRAVVDHRWEDFRASLQAIEDVVLYAMDLLSKGGLKWRQPGAQPDWPPLLELIHHLQSFRKEVFAQGGQEYIGGLLDFEHWLVTEGIKQRCGELFTAGLAGYREDYQIANENRFEEAECRGMLLGHVGLVTRQLFFAPALEQPFPFIQEIDKHQEDMLFQALQAGRSEEYKQLNRRFKSSLEQGLQHWQSDSANLAPSRLQQRRDTEQNYRTALMGLAGLALFMDQEGSIGDVNPYLIEAREEYRNLDQLANDITRVLRSGDHLVSTNWHGWERARSSGGRAQRIAPERYPFAFFSLRLMELSADSMTALNLRGTASRVSEWFERYSSWIGNYVHSGTIATIEQRRVWANAALHQAVRMDEVEEDNAIIGRNLSADRVSAFKSDVYAAAFGNNPVEQAFQRAGSFLYLSGDDEEAPEESSSSLLVLKAFLAENPEATGIYYSSLPGDEWGRAISREIMELLCEELDKSAKQSALLDTPTSLMQTVDVTATELVPSGHLLIVLAGNWSGIEAALYVEKPPDFVPEWQLPENDHIGAIGHFHGFPILRGPIDGERRLYVVDPTTWGCFTLAQFDNAQDLLIEIEPLSEERAKQLLVDNPDHFPEQTDEESKRRKLRTCVEIKVAGRFGFRVTDPSKARQFVDVRENERQEPKPS